MEDLRDPNLDYHVTVKLTDLGLTLNEDLCRKNLEKIPSTGIGPIRRRRSAFRGETAGGPNANLTTNIIRRGFHAVVLVTP